VITDKKSAEAITAFSADDCQKRFIIFSVHAASLLTLFLYENINDVIVQKNVINSVCCRNFSIISPRVFRHSVQ
jgi:hypothetical protein